MLYIIDTDICVFALRRHPDVLSRLSQHSPEDIAVTAVTEAELFYGAQLSRRTEDSRAAVDAFLHPIARLPFDTMAAEWLARTRGELGRPIGERDLITASIALANSATVVSHHLTEFRLVPGLMLEDWLSHTTVTR